MNEEKQETPRDFLWKAIKVAEIKDHGKVNVVLISDALEAVEIARKEMQKKFLQEKEDAYNAGWWNEHNRQFEIWQKDIRPRHEKELTEAEARGCEKGKKETAKTMCREIECELLDLDIQGGYLNILSKKWREIKSRWCKE